jgi:predicted kinase
MRTADKTVYLLVGPRGSGKSNYCDRMVSRQQDLAVVSRDAIMLQLFGSVHSNKYEGGHEYAFGVMQERLRTLLSAENGIRLVLDAWTGTSRERKALISVLREYGATRVIALYFITPVEYVEKWFWLKPKIARIGEMSEKHGQGYTFFGDDVPRRDHELFHRYAADIDSDGFDQVIRVNPLQELLLFG